MESSKDIKIKELFNSLLSEDGMARKSARKELVRIGNDVVDYLIEYVNHPKHLYRWEAMKTLEEIADPSSIPLFIEALEDDESDIRWIAAEGLINIGEESIEPLLKNLIEKSNSVFVLERAHHVFHDLNKEGNLPDNFPVNEFLTTIKKSNSEEAIKLLAYQILNEKNIDLN